MSPLHDYQATARDFLLDRLYVRGWPGSGLFLDPGLGKTRITLEALDFLHAVGVTERTLIVAPLRVCHLVWPQEVAKWGIPLSIGSLRERYCDAQLELINPESLHKVKPGRYDCIVIDESTRFKTWGTKRMRVMRKLLPTIKKRIILTGTPAANSLGDLHAQMFLLDDGETLGKNVTVFRTQYMRKGGWQGREWQFRDDKRELITERVAPWCLRMDAESFLDMPELVTNPIWCEMPAAAMREYKRLKRELLAELETGNILALNAASAYTKMRQLVNGCVYNSEGEPIAAHTAKLQALDDLRSELGGKPLLVFYQWKHDVDRVREKLEASQPKPRVAVMPPSSAMADCERIVDEWNDDKIDVLLAHPQSTGHGLNLQHGSAADIAWFGLHNSPEVYDQAFRRLYRQGQKNKQIRVHQLLCSGTIEATMKERNEGKFKNQSEFFDAIKEHAQTT